MPRRIIRKLSAKVQTLRDRWYVRVFGQRLTDPALWSLQRRGITGAFAVGLAICFVPLPVHIPLAIACALLMRLNVPVIVGTIFLVNPLTMVPVYYLAYRVGALTLGWKQKRFHFELSWDWLQYGLGPLWKPFLLGCAICAVLAAVLGWVALEFVWRQHVRKKYRERHQRLKT